MGYGNTVKDGTGSFWHLLVDTLGRLRINDEWSPYLTADENANDSDKSFTVDASYEWEIQSIWVELTTTADVGNRQLVVEIQDDAADVIYQVRAGIVQAASLARYYAFAVSATELTSFRDTDYLSTLIPGLRLPASYVIRVYDKAAVAAAADDMIVQVLVKRRSV